MQEKQKAQDEISQVKSEKNQEIENLKD